MTPLRTDVWKRKGLSLLWSAEVLAAFSRPTEVASLREFFAMSHRWRDDYLRSSNASALIVAGLEGCLDLLSSEDAGSWLVKRFLPTVLSFQDAFESEAALVFWLPSGKNRIRQNVASEAYRWHCAGTNSRETIEIGRILWAGAEKDAMRILDPSAQNQDPDGPAWIGIYLPRLS